MLDVGLEAKWKTSEYEAWVLDTRLLCMGSCCRIAPREHTHTNTHTHTHTHIYIFIVRGSKTPSGPGLYHYRGFTITLRHTELGRRTPLDEWSACHRDLYLTRHNSYYRQTHAPCGFRTRNPSKRAAVALRLRLLGHWDRLHNILHSEIESMYSQLQISSSWFWHMRMNCANGSLLLVRAQCKWNNQLVKIRTKGIIFQK